MPPDRRPGRDETHEPPRRARPASGQRHEVDLPSDDRPREDHGSEGGGEGSDARHEASKLELVQRPRLHGEGPANEAKRSGHDECAGTASNEGRGSPASIANATIPAGPAPIEQATSAL